MENITFKQFLITYSFKLTNADEIDNFDDTQAIRIHLPMENKDNWFDFGIYDYGTKEQKLEKLEKIFTEDILNSYIDTISTKVYSTYCMVEIFLTNKEKK